MLYGEALRRTKPIPANIIRLSCTSVFLLLLLAVATYISSSGLSPKTAVLAALSGTSGTTVYTNIVVPKNLVGDINVLHVHLDQSIVYYTANSSDDS
jgi:hypothetical protein